MTEINEKLLENLRIISQIRENDKLSTYTSICNISIDQSSPLQFIWRRLYGDDRTKAISYLQNLVNQAVSTSNSLMDSKYVNIYDNDYEPTQHEKNNYMMYCKFLNKLAIELTNSKKGYNNLKITYSDDSTVKARLDGINDKINDQIQLINDCLDRIKYKEKGKIGYKPIVINYTDDEEECENSDDEQGY